MLTSLLIHSRATPDESVPIKDSHSLKRLYTPPKTHARVLSLLSSPSIFPCLDSLRLIYAIFPFEEITPRTGQFPYDEPVQDEWAVPWETLLASRDHWRRFEVTLPTDWEGCFQELRRRRTMLMSRNDFMLTAEFEYRGFMPLPCVFG